MRCTISVEYSIYVFPFVERNTWSCIFHLFRVRNLQVDLAILTNEIVIDNTLQSSWLGTQAKLIKLDLALA